MFQKPTSFPTIIDPSKVKELISNLTSNPSSESFIDSAKKTLIELSDALLRNANNQAIPIVTRFGTQRKMLLLSRDLSRAISKAYNEMGLEKEKLREFLMYCNYKSYEGFAMNGKRQGFGIDRSLQNEFLLIGFWNEGMMKGTGIQIYRNGALYEGPFENNKKHGQGKLTFTDRSTSEGLFVEGRIPTNGKFTYPNGCVYLGELNEDGERTGYGEFVFHDGRRLKGNWDKNRMEGVGKLIYADGSIYEGDWKKNKKHGKGKQTSADGSIYDGDWKDDKKNGKGKQTSADGSIYEGDWKDDRRHGQGNFIEADRMNRRNFTYKKGYVYDGDWNEDKRSGYGRCTSRVGYWYEGYWNDDKRHGQGVCKWPDGRMYDGEFNNDEMYGMGTYTWPDGKKYTGEWRKQKKWGKGELIMDGVKYTGDFQYGFRHGNITEEDANGNVTHSTWKNDERVSIKRTRDSSCEEPPSKVQKKCGYKECTSNNPDRYYYAARHTTAGGQNWSDWGEETYCEFCYTRFTATGSFKRKQTQKNSGPR